MEELDVVILGAGAAGMMCALTAGRRGRRVLLLDHAAEAGKKILISGGGRCNFTNLHTRARPLLLGQSAFLQVGAGPLHAAGFPRSGRKARHRLARKDARAIVLRRLGAGDRRHAAGRMRGRRRGAAHRPAGDRRDPRRPLPGGDRRMATSRPPRWCWRPAGCRSRRWAPPGSRMTSPGASACRSPRRARHWCRCCCRPNCWPGPRRSAACRSTWSRAAGAAGSARRCCSPIAACPARRSCRSPPTGARARRSSWTCCPTAMPPRWSQPSARARNPACAPHSPNCCRSAWPISSCPKTLPGRRWPISPTVPWRRSERS